ncbi:PLP-dependent aminotransferase family protein [Brevibacillus borstelensis]|jgi:GntR family transcriptional regulator / MocR family aminotransferase|uniref:aminotransferase-like domain-containing protein n=1 Tax=Brevibacillus borstelensis TaxID=45462 RepID=UPI000F099EA9|nr:PLP-dependent aminotransferase family protein [Brevibacillus borstelensis]MCM3621641.1 PLP-dependent aminotransferase family protein [Brevibacillus borstelensis]MED1884122.1 PLP-dependent aminotransferase family protein [Brevibacillus borstelensis]RNB63533.1 PLP-dependent aminotransferase family protein [Brevibacillus borstelensis]GED50992.1 GntR family transcriptional regulator [Brevibacillus borstelensis]
MPNRPFFSFHFHKHSKTPLNVQLFEQLQTAILRGAFLQGDQLISLREMKAITGCSLETVKKAYDLLVQHEWVEALHGKGYFLTAKAREMRRSDRLPLADIPLFSLADSTPPPGDDLLRRLRSSFADSVNVLTEQAGQKKIRRIQAADAYCVHLNSRGIPAAPERLLLFNRSTSAFTFVVQQLMQKTDIVFVEEYHYPVFSSMLKHCGITAKAIPLDREGIDIEALEAATKAAPPGWLLINPHHHFPTGISYSRKRKEYLLDWAERNRVTLLENDHHGDLWFRRPSRTLYQLAVETGRSVPVYTLHSFSKTLGRDLQLGALVLPSQLTEEERERLRQLVSLTGAEPSLLILEAAVSLLNDPWFAEVYLAERRSLFFARWQCLLQEQPQALPAHARLLPIKGGLNTWIEWGTPSPHAAAQEERVITLLREEGLELAAGKSFRLPDEPEGLIRRPAVRFPLAPLDKRELTYWLQRLGAMLLR